METLLLTVHLIICTILIAVILVQAGKGASIGAAFGGGASQTLFGGRGPATFFQKFTTIVALLFLVTSIGLARLAKSTEGSVIEKVPAKAAPAVPTSPTAPPAAPDAATETAPTNPPKGTEAPAQ